jgi:hypothetical protein
MNTDHVQCYTCEVSCNHCGLAPTLDAMSAVALIDVVRGFLLMHRRCEKPLEPSRQVDLFDELAAKEPELVAPKCCGQRVRCINCPIPIEVFDKFPGALPGIDGMSDEPDPETDPPEHDQPALTDEDDAFGRAYPMARDHLSLRMNLEVVFQGPAPSTGQLAIYPVGSPEFDTIAHWCRMQLAEMNKRSHPELDVYLPKPPQPMPKVLKALMKPKRGARPLTQPKRRKPRSEQSFHGSGGVD